MLLVFFTSRPTDRIIEAMTIDKIATCWTFRYWHGVPLLFRLVMTVALLSIIDAPVVPLVLAFVPDSGFRGRLH